MDEINYTKIIIDGWMNPQTKKHLYQYFKRQCKKAIEDGYSEIEFFDGCQSSLRAIYDKMEFDFLDRQNKLFMAGMDKEAEKLTIEDTPLNLLNLTKGRFVGNLYASDLKEITGHLTIAYNQIKKPIKKPKEIQPLDFNLNQTDLVHFFDLLVDADIIKEPIDAAHKDTGGFYQKLADYFTAKGKKINPKSAKSTKTNKENKGTSYSQSYYETLKNLKATIEKKLDPKSLQ